MKEELITLETAELAKEKGFSYVVLEVVTGYQPVNFVERMCISEDINFDLY